jgi:hypothetical protein
MLAVSPSMLDSSALNKTARDYQQSPVLMK